MTHADGAEAGRQALLRTKCGILRRQHRGKGWNSLPQSCWDRRDVEMWMVPNQAPSPASLASTPRKDSDKGEDAPTRREEGSTGSQDVPPTPPIPAH